MTTLREFIEAASEKIELHFNAKGVVYPMFHFIDDDGRDVIMMAPPGDKDQSTKAARDILKIARAKRCVLINEAWVLDQLHAGVEEVQEAERLLRQGGSIEHHPKRVEIVMFAAEDENEVSQMAYREIVRKINSRPRLGPLQFMPTGGTTEGRMVGLLPRLKKMSS